MFPNLYPYIPEMVWRVVFLTPKEKLEEGSLFFFFFTCMENELKNINFLCSFIELLQGLLNLKGTICSG